MEKIKALCTVGEILIGLASVEKSMEFPQKIKTRARNPTSGHISEGNKIHNEEIYASPC